MTTKSIAWTGVRPWRYCKNGYWQTPVPKLPIELPTTSDSVSTSWMNFARAWKMAHLRLSFISATLLTPADLDRWQAADFAKHWADRGRSVVLAVERGTVERLNGAQRLQLRDQLNRWGITLEEGDQSRLANGAVLLAELIRPLGPALVFASRDHSAAIGDERWGVLGSAPIVRF